MHWGALFLASLCQVFPVNARGQEPFAGDPASDGTLLLEASERQIFRPWSHVWGLALPLTPANLLPDEAWTVTKSPEGYFGTATLGDGSRDVSPLGAFTRSLFVPGLAQRSLGQRRWIAYAALEVAAVWYYLDRRSAAKGVEGQYRDLAWSVARSAVDPAQPRQDREFSYYETMGEWERSGAFDVAEDPGLQPEGDPTTFNGSIWGLAQQIFLGGEQPSAEARRRAMDYYRARAYGSAFLWDWTNRPQEMALFNDLIMRSDQRFAQATNALGVLLANHLLSGLDGFVSARVRTTGYSRGSQRIEVSVHVR